ncbi:MAG TPA: GNAT family N-acetyltransferase [Tepidisphaeraceae bacterium]
MLFRRFKFLDPGPLIDGELELVRPDPQWFDDLLAACSHPLTARDAPNESKTTRKQLEQFLRIAPWGHEPADGSPGRVPQYHFWMRVRHEVSPAPGQIHPPVRIAGGIGFRVGTTHTIEMYYGHFGYHVYPPARGSHFAERACRLLFPLALCHGIKTLWITCNPDNYGSRRTCERLGGRLTSIVPVPENDPLYLRGEREKCRYRIELTSI